MSGWGRGGSGLKTAFVVCWLLATGSVVLAFFGSSAAGALMSHALPLAVTAVLLCGLAGIGARALARRRFASALLHLGCACVMAGWLMGRVADRMATPDAPTEGAMALADGDASDRLWDSETLAHPIGRLPFSVRLERFLIDHYPASPRDTAEGRQPPVKEYRSRVTILEPGREPYVANIRVNHPVAIRGYSVYQMSWGESVDQMGRPVTYTVLQFIRDPGLPVVYAGFVILFLGTLLFAVSSLSRCRIKPISSPLSTPHS